MLKTRLKPILLVEIIDILGFLLLFLFGSYDVNIIYAGLALCAINLMAYSIIYFTGMGDGYLFLMVSMLVSIGIIMMFRLNIDRGFLQMRWFVFGIAIMFAVYVVYKMFKHWGKLKYLYILLTAALFIITLVFGETINGSKNWVKIAQFNFQPSEIIKILYVFVLASFFGNNTEINEIPQKRPAQKLDYILMGYVYMCLGFLVLQREWGTAVLFVLIYFAMMYLYSAPLKLFLINIAVAVLGCVGGYFLTTHIRTRVTTWLDPWADATGKGYQITQSLIAIASGGFFGAGLGSGNPYLIPEVHSDFIFAAICEEMGLVMGVAIIMLYFIFSYRGFKIALTNKHPFDKALSLGLVTCFAFQTFIIVGGVIKFIPLTGITLPFVSYGGSSMVSCFIILGLLTAISHNDRP